MGKYEKIVENRWSEDPEPDHIQEDLISQITNYIRTHNLTIQTAAKLLNTTDNIIFLVLERKLDVLSYDDLAEVVNNIPYDAHQQPF